MTNTCPPHHWNLDSEGNGYCIKCQSPYVNKSATVVPLTKEDKRKIYKCKQLGKVLIALDEDPTIDDEYRKEVRPVFENILAHYKHG
jgi:hypothetical protein